MAKHKYYEKGSLADLGNIFLKELNKFTQSGKPSYRLMAMNAFLVVLVLTFNFSYGFNLRSSDILAQTINLIVMSIISAVVGLVYLKIIETVSNLVNGDEFAHNVAISILFFSVTSSIIGFFLNNELLINISRGLILVQLIAILLINKVKLPKLEEKTSSQGIDIWTILDRILIISGIINLIWGVLAFFFH